MTARSVPPPGPDAPPIRLVLLGHPVAHSLSPTFQNAALAAAGLPQRYATLDVAPAQLGNVLDMLREERAAGNVTVPHKLAVAAACDVVSDVARTVGAVNTFWHRADGTRVGDNTDVAGAQSALRALRPDAPHTWAPRVIVIGAGGAAAAAIVATARVWPASHVAIRTRRDLAARALASALEAHVALAIADGDALGGADLVVNATPLGLRADDALPCDVTRLAPGAAVLDLVYGTHETPWVHAARAAGHDAQDGLLMLVEQGAAAFERWFGRAPDRSRMWRAVAERTGREAPGEAR